MADLYKVTMPDGTVKFIQDAQARLDIEDLKEKVTGAMHYLGESTTAISDGASTSPVTVEGISVIPNAGDIVTYGHMEFVWSELAHKWREFGSTGSLKALAFKSTASGQFTPSGSVSQPEFTGKQATINSSFTPAGSVTISKGNGTANYTPQGTVTISKGTGTANYTPAGTVSKPTFSGTEATVSVSGTPSGSVTIGTGSGTSNYTPAGSVSAPGVTVTPDTTTVNSITNVGTLPTCTLPTLSLVVSGTNLKATWNAGSFSAGTLPTKGNNTTVVTGIKSATATAPTFTGTGVQLTGSFSGNAMTSSGKYTPAGTVTQPTFTGTGAELKAEFNGTGAELKGTFSGTAGTATATYTPEGEVSQPAFTGNQETVTVS